MNGNSSESAAIKLAHMQGELNLIARLVNDLAPVVSTHSEAITALRLAAQKLGLDADASADKVVSTAQAMKDKRETDAALVKSDAAKEDESWQPITKLFAAVSVIASIGVLVLAAYAALKS